MMASGSKGSRRRDMFVTFPEQKDRTGLYDRDITSTCARVSIARSEGRGRHS